MIKITIRLGLYENRMRNYVVELQRIAKKVKGIRSLAVDVGCGSGFFSKVLSKYGFTVIAIDIDEKVIRELKEKNSNIMSVVADAHILPLRNNIADLILSISLIEHLEHPEEHVKESYRVLKPSGIFFIQIPNLKYFLEPHTRFPLLGLLPKVIKLKVLQYIEYYINFDVTLNYLLNMLRNVNFKEVGLRYLYHDRLMKFLRYPPSYIILAVRGELKMAKDITSKLRSNE